MKHTKGKFKISEPIQVDGGDFIGDIEHPDYIGWYAEISGKSYEEQQNNARLISKAPEMYEALKSFVPEDLEIKNFSPSLIKTVELLKEIDNG